MLRLSACHSKSRTETLRDLGRMVHCQAQACPFAERFASPTASFGRDRDRREPEAAGKTFTITAKGASAANKYIQSARLNGRTLAGGGTRALEMGPRPNKAWCGAPEAAPPSMSRVFHGEEPNLATIPDKT